MLYILWALITVALILCLLVLFFKAFVAFRRKAGLALTLLLCIALFAFAGGKSPRVNTENGMLVPDTVLEQGTYSRYRIRLESTPLPDYTLRATTARSRDGKMVLVHSSAYALGWSIGNEWKTASINLTLTDTGIDYEVNGVVEWKLLIFTLYREKKQFKGSAKYQDNKEPY